LQMKNDAVILVNGNTMKAYGVLMRVAPEPLDEWTVDPGFAQVQDTFVQYIGDAIAYIDIDIVFRHAQDAIEFLHLSILCLSGKRPGIRNSDTLSCIINKLLLNPYPLWLILGRSIYNRWC
jgi:hypothetical protein